MTRLQSIWEVTDYRRWMALTLLIRLVIFAFLAVEFHTNWVEELMHYGIVVEQNDTSGYYEPMESWVQGNGYAGACRMPGLLPMYALLRTVLSPAHAEVGMIVLQFLVGAVAIYLAALGAYHFRSSKLLFLLVYGLMVVNTYVSAWDHSLMSDSFSISFLVITFYLLSLYYRRGGYGRILLAGAMLCWAIFTRPSHLLFLPAAGLVVLVYELQNRSGWRRLVLAGMVLCLPIVTGISAWAIRNQVLYNKRIILQDDDEHCFGTLAEYHISLRNLVISWGCDYQEWSVNTELAWFLDRASDVHYDFPPHVYTSQCNYDTLVALKSVFTSAWDQTLDPEVRREYQNQVITWSNELRENYRREKPMHYYLWNRLRLIRLFIFPSRLDNLPLPGQAEMNILEFAVKSFYHVMLLFLSGGMVIAACRALWVRDPVMWIFLTFPLVLVLIIGAILGYAEQRYLAPAYPFMVMSVALLITDLCGWWRNQRNSTPGRITT